MKKDKIILFVLMIPLIFLFILTFFLICQKETGKNIILPIVGYDPRDLLSGRYIQYRIDWEKADCKQFENNICPKKEFDDIDRFYISEKYANELDKIFREDFFQQKEERKKFEIIYSYKKNKKPIAQKLLINGIDCYEFVKKFE